MKKTAVHWLRDTIVAIAATFLLTACVNEGPLGPLTTLPPAAQIDAGEIEASSNSGRTGIDLSACPKLQAPAGSRLAFRVYAKGVQIYSWNGTSWTFIAPLATLSADGAGHSTIGTHYAGPTWESNSGSKVVATVIERCTPDANAIPWLSLGAVSNSGPGPFNGATFIQRVNTVGGLAPASAGSVGEEARVPYTTEYLFYKTK